MSHHHRLMYSLIDELPHHQILELGLRNQLIILVFFYLRDI
jgi:hypothetical protein